MNGRIGLCSHSLCDQAVGDSIRDAGLTIAFHVHDPAEAIAACQSHRPDALLLSHRHASDLRPLLGAHPGMAIILLLEEPDFHAAQEARRQGAAEVLLLPDDLAGLPSLLQRLTRGTPLGSRPTERNRLILVCAPKGGCGSSTVAAGLGLALAPEALLVDLNLTYGGAETLLNLKPDRTVLDLAPLAAELEERHLLQAATPHSSGLAVLCAPARAGLDDRLEAAAVEAILAVCRHHWAHVVVDLPGTNVELLAALAREADQVLLVTTPDPVAMRSVHLLLQGGGLAARGQVGLVVNRWTSQSPFRPADVASRLGLTLLAAVPEDPALAERVALGQPLIPADRQRPGRAASALLKLAAQVSPSGQKGRRDA